MGGERWAALTHSSAEPPSTERTVMMAESWRPEKIMRNHGAHEFWHIPLAVLAREFINAAGVGLALVGRTTSLVGIVEDVKVITSSVISGKNIGD